MHSILLMEEFGDVGREALQQIPPDEVLEVAHHEVRRLIVRAYHLEFQCQRKDV